MDGKIKQQRFAAEVAGLLEKYNYTGAVIVHFERNYKDAVTMQLVKLAPPTGPEQVLAEVLSRLNEKEITSIQGKFSSDVKFGWPGNRKG